MTKDDEIRLQIAIGEALATDSLPANVHQRLEDAYDQAWPGDEEQTFKMAAYLSLTSEDFEG